MYIRGSVGDIFRSWWIHRKHLYEYDAADDITLHILWTTVCGTELVVFSISIFGHFYDHFMVITSEEAEEWFLKNYTSIYCLIPLTFPPSSWPYLFFLFLFLPLFVSSQFSCVFAHFAQLRDFFWIEDQILSICDSLRSVNWILIHWIQWISKFRAKSGWNEFGELW